MKVDPPWWFCRGWWSPWCVIDIALHKAHLPIRWVCERHGQKIHEGIADE